MSCIKYKFSIIPPYYMDAIYNCRGVCEIDVIDSDISKVYIDWDYKNNRILVRSIEGWYFLESSDLTVGQVIEKIGYNNHFIQVIWASNGKMIEMIDTPVKNANLSIIRIHNLKL